MKINIKRIFADAILTIHWGIIIAWFLGFWLLLKERVGGEIYRFFYPTILFSQIIFRGCLITRWEARLRKRDPRFFHGPLIILMKKIIQKESLLKILATSFTWLFSLFGFYLALTRG